MTWVWEQSAERSTRLLMLLAIADHCNDDGVCYPSVGRLAAKCRITVRRAQQVIDTLKHNGDLGVVINHGIETNGGRTNRYYLNRYRHSLGLKPVGQISKRAPFQRAKHPPEEIDREGGAETFTHPPEETDRGRGENDCTTPPAKDFTQTVRLNRQGNRQHTPATGSAEPYDVCVENGLAGIEQMAWDWAIEHPFWSTRITTRDALQRNLAVDKAFRAQFLAACIVCRSDRPVRSQSAGQNTHDAHAAFWQRISRVIESKPFEDDNDDPD